MNVKTSLQGQAAQCPGCVEVMMGIWRMLSLWVGSLERTSCVSEPEQDTVRVSTSAAPPDLLPVATGAGRHRLQHEGSDE